MKQKKKKGYNHDNVIAGEESTIAEKIIKLSPNEDIVLNKKFINGKPDVWLKNHNLIIEVDEGIHENFTAMRSSREKQSCF